MGILKYFSITHWKTIPTEISVIIPGQNIDHFAKMVINTQLKSIYKRSLSMYYA